MAENRYMKAAQSVMLQELLEKNKSVPFVDRILNPNRYPVRPNEDGSVSTHLLTLVGGKGEEPIRVMPKLQFVEGKWKESSSRKDIGDTINRGNFIEFPSSPEGLKQAKQFAEGSWKKLPSTRKAAGERDLLRNPMPPKLEK